MTSADCIRSALTTPLLQEVTAAVGHGVAAVGFSLALVAQRRAMGVMCRPGIAWVRSDAIHGESGDLYGPGLAAFGIEPHDCLIIRTRTFADTLRAALEAVRCPALGAVLLETGQPLDLTASRRLKLSAEHSGVAPILIRHAEVNIPNAATVRWRVRATPTCDDAARLIWPLPPWTTLDVMLTKHPAGLAGKRWRLEWNHERGQFDATLSQSVDAVPDGRLLAA